MAPESRPETRRELWREATPVQRRRLVFLLASLALFVIIAVAAAAAGVWVTLSLPSRITLDCSADYM